MAVEDDQPPPPEPYEVGLVEPHWRQAGGPFAEYDTLDRKQPRRHGIPDYLLMIARIEPARVRRVPSVAIEDEGTDDAGGFAFVNCPCGARPIVRDDLEKCKGCERYYVLVSTGRVYLTYGAMSPPALPVGP